MDIRVRRPDNSSASAPSSAGTETIGARFHARMALVCLGIALFSIVGMPMARLTISFDQLCAHMMPACNALLLAFACRWRGMSRLTNVLVMVFWGAMVTRLHTFPMFILARRDVPLCDPLLAELDATLGLQAPDIIAWAEGWPGLPEFLAVCYDALLPLLSAALIVPPLLNQLTRAKEFAVSVLASALIGMTMFAVVQAAGPWVHHGYEGNPGLERFLTTFRQLKSDEWLALDTAFLDGLICCPSFHTILAILAAAALWPNRLLRLPVSLLTALILLSTITRGGHYVADVLAGVLVAFASLALARGYLWLESMERTVRRGRRTRGTSDTAKDTAHRRLSRCTRMPRNSGSCDRRWQGPDGSPRRVARETVGPTAR